MTNRIDRRRGGFSVMEFSASFALVAMMVFGADWVRGAGEAVEATRETRSQALAIAQGQTQVARNLDWARMAPTPDFVPAPWVRQPGYAVGEVPIEITGDGVDPDARPEVYDVEVRVTDLDRSGHLRRIEVRVGYDRAGGDRGWVDVETVRAG